ncbi:type I restriction endonuclease subunit R [Neptunomonas qingdaonensis]|uniref:Type I restriction enzyme endonuclease subunit n=1 Tax=Neptunomonas qingdaonensis TaxID=1045558 RepID=A0A1I2NF81_9GAMM|nr:type I restriction endonuclease subunit R [Neptunomonas qingdaonensis]SFG01509.1 type I restriction enzyme, R subunit [Neptunomonas qingdaonensis]
MSVQPEAILEDNLIAQLSKQGFEVVSINDEASLLANLKNQLEKLNDMQLSSGEFKQVLNRLGKGTIFEKAKTLRDRLQINKEDGTAAYIRFLHEESEKNNYQVTQQVTVEGRYKNRYDVTVLINGLPLIQIELKRRGLELKEAFNQINRYQRHSYWASYGLFQYVQIFVISNGVNTKYYANNKSQSFKQTFFWADEHNNRYTDLTKFAEMFLRPAHLSKMLNNYVVLNETGRFLMVMRSYQIYATEAIVERVNTSDQNGYIWHATGSGKTLTSFKVAQILTTSPEVHKVVFVVDRKDLDFQTSKEFNAFAKGCVDSTDNTKVLVDQFTDAPVPANKINEQRNSKLIVTTIQKLNNAISHKRYTKKMDKLKDKSIVFIFDECHRSQFGETHQRIVSFFNNHQLFGFTGTPIFVENAHSKASRKYTTKDLFDECLHKYTIVDAIKDENVLKFGIEYVGRYKEKEGSKNAIDIEVEGIDTQELLEAPMRLNKIADYIIANHKSKTHSKAFTGMFCVSSVPALIEYYKLFQQKKEAGEHDLRIATIFSYAANEEDPDANGFLDSVDEAPDIEGIAEASSNYGANTFTHSRDKLEQFIGDYNQMFGTRYTTKDSESYYNYYNDISKKVRERKIDILLVVNMFLTGFDSQPLNTLYVDKNLKHHGLIQAYSRTNRILNEQKSQGNIVCFRNLKAATDTALTLFANKDAKETVIMPPYEEFLKLFNQAYGKLLSIAPDLESVDDLADEEQELAFVQAYRELLRLKNILSTFADFSFDDVKIDEQEFEDYKSKYLDLYDKVRTDNQTQKTSILEDVDFELELIHRDEINVRYITQLIAKLKGTDNNKDYEYQYKSIMDLLGGTPELRSKKELIEKFIKTNLDKVQTPEQVGEAFDAYWEVEKHKALTELCEEESLVTDSFKAMVDRMIYTNRSPLRDDVFDVLQAKPKLLQRENVFNRVTDKVRGFVETFYKGF